MGLQLAGVLTIAFPCDELVRRLSGRWICDQCQTPYHTVSAHQPRKESATPAAGHCASGTTTGWIRCAPASRSIISRQRPWLTAIGKRVRW